MNRALLWTKTQDNLDNDGKAPGDLPRTVRLRKPAGAGARLRERQHEELSTQALQCFRGRGRSSQVRLAYSARF